ncbi:MAG: type 2 isopentenyl-diphosphate Delta-isomerase [Chloroflexi bacterium]|nr:type 2 isopentenyl-diphosphate Delta-isomerase [Chloroflexota bacterium]
MARISQRKEDHLRIALQPEVQEAAMLSFAALRLEHNALPEVDLADVDLTTGFLGHRLRAPLLIGAMTGGTDRARAINRNLAAAAEATGVAFSVGSQRAALMHSELRSTYAVRDVAPTVMLFANLGAVQLRRGFGFRECQDAIAMIQADGLILHVNALQEALQQDGDTTFSGLEEAIGSICHQLSQPVIVKEVGFGISASVAARLRAAGVAAVDVQGAGGTSWSRIEGTRTSSARLAHAADAFAGWGIPTPLCIAQVRACCPDLPLIGGGGIRSGVDAAKALALGADVVTAAQPFLEPATLSMEAVIERIEQMLFELRVAMFTTGCQRINDLRQVPIYLGAHRYPE